MKSELKEEEELAFPLKQNKRSFFLKFSNKNATFREQFLYSSLYYFYY